MIAQHGTELLDVCLNGLAGIAIPYRDQGFIAFQVAGNGTCTRVRVVSQNGVAHVVEVRHLHVIEQNHVLQLRGISHHSVFTHNGRAAQKSALTHFSAVIDDQRTSQISAVEHRGILGNPHAFCGVVELVLRQRGAQFQNEILDVRQRVPGVGKALQQGCRNRVCQVVQIRNSCLHGISSRRVFCGPAA